MQYNTKYLGIQDYELIWQRMKDFTNSRDESSIDEFWVLEHPSVFTLGLAGEYKHILDYQHNIPILKSDRGGQVTYHGRGQLIIYTLINLKALELNIRALVIALEQSIIYVLNSIGLKANGDRNAPGVYINGAKIASLGLRVRHGCTYHGLSLNYNVDLEPFNYINVCGYSKLAVTSIAQLGVANIITMDDLADQIIQKFTNIIYNK